MPHSRPIRALSITTGALLLGLTLAAQAGRAERPKTFAPTEAAGARLYYQGDIPIAIFAGSPEEIGRQHGALLAKPEAGLLKYPKQLLAAGGAEYMWPLLVGAGQMLMKNAPDAHRREMAALAHAGKLDAGDLAVGNTLLELRRMGCSVLMVEPAHSATSGPLFGRNLDFPTLGQLDKYSIVFIMKPTGRHAFASVCFPDIVGVISGMNDSGLAVATLDVEASADGSPKFDPTGTPLAFVFRRILEECTTVAEAEKLLRSEKPTTWMNLAVCDKSSSAVFEITPRHIGRRDPEGGICPCTNHFRTDGLTLGSLGEMCERFVKLSKAAGAAPLTVDNVRTYLDAANQGDLTLQTMVFEPATLALHLSIGPPPSSDDPLTKIDLRSLFAGPTAAKVPTAAAQ